MSLCRHWCPSLSLYVYVAEKHAAYQSFYALTNHISLTNSTKCILRKWSTCIRFYHVYVTYDNWRNIWCIHKMHFVFSSHWKVFVFSHFNRQATFHEREQYEMVDVCPVPKGLPECRHAISTPMPSQGVTMCTQHTAHTHKFRPVECPSLVCCNDIIFIGAHPSAAACVKVAHCAGWLVGFCCFSWRHLCASIISKMFFMTSKRQLSLMFERNEHEWKMPSAFGWNLVCWEGKLQARHDWHLHIYILNIRAVFYITHIITERRAIIASENEFTLTIRSDMRPTHHKMHVEMN